jgi:excisionase family DNA binding protein
MLPVPTDETYLRVADAASIVGLSRSTLLRLIAKDRGVPVVRIGSTTLRIPASGLHAWMARQQEARQ